MIELVGRFIRWFVRYIGGSTLFRLLLLFLTLLSIGTGLIAVVGHLNPAWLPTTIIYAILVGWLFGRTRLPGWGSALALLAIGLIWLVLSVGQMTIPIDLFLPTLPPVLRLIILRIPPDPLQIILLFLERDQEFVIEIPSHLRGAVVLECVFLGLFDVGEVHSGYDGNEPVILAGADPRGGFLTFGLHLLQAGKAPMAFYDHAGLAVNADGIIEAMLRDALVNQAKVVVLRVLRPSQEQEFSQRLVGDGELGGNIPRLG